ncbi:MAG: hypothetical protein FWF79_06295 [Defluviitaleaceae bacterium]|nr:hypothetical protein [Defluviitaleaceae bacterium]
MDKPHGIMVFGASGAGCTTMGRELARLLNFEHFDTDDYFFEINNPPFEMKERPLNERISLLRPLLLKNNFVLSIPFHLQARFSCRSPYATALL